MFNRFLTVSLLDKTSKPRLKYFFHKSKLNSCYLNLGVNGVRSNFFTTQNNNTSVLQAFPLHLGKRFYASDTKIYTKTGDLGTSSLNTGERRSKNDTTFNVLGNIDELSSFIGAAKENALEKKHDYVEQLERIQCILQDIGTLIATPIQVQNIRRGRVSASLHVCRTVCRRAERSVVSLVDEGVVDRNVLVYLNRMSDFLFTVARHATILDGKKETIYIRPKPIKDSKKPLKGGKG